MPVGTVTFLFTDLEGSTALWEQHPEAMRAALARHDELLAGAIESHGGYVVKTTGDGFLAAFASAPDAVGAAIDAQLAFAREPWGETGPLRVRMGIHTGEAEVREGDYHGPTLNRAARLMSVGHGGQLLVSRVTSELIAHSGVDLLDLGSHQLRGLAEPEHVFQVIHPQLESDFGSLRSVVVARPLPPSNLPARVDRLIGRTRELTEIENRLRTNRLLTLLGPGGTGKTRLALEAASNLRDDFDTRVYLVDLSASRDVESVLSVTARTLAVRDQDEGSLLDAIKDQLGSQTTLVVFDNFEQVTAAALIVAELLRDCPGLTQLVTSREVLHVTGEQVYAIPPLALPAADAGRLSVAELSEYAAVQLFVERARAVRADFELTPDNAHAVVELCTRLDGLPLAIELATARLALFSPQALVDRLSDRLDLLTGGARDAPERQRTLRDTISWSYELLTAGEQRLIALLAVFAGATLEAVEAVAERALGMEATEVLDGLGSLVNKSLVRQADDPCGGTRLSMLETIRAFASERLHDEPGMLDSTVRVHAEYFADWTVQYIEKLTGDERVAASDRMAADIENLIAAWRYWVDASDFEQLRKLADGLWLLYNARGWYHETTTLITDLLDVLSASSPSEDLLVQQILLQTSLARVLMGTKGFTAETERAYERALELGRARGEFPQLLPVLRGLSTFYIFLGKFEKSMAIGAQLLELAERFDDPKARVEGHLLVGASKGFVARLQPAIETLEQGITAYEAAPHTVGRFEAGNDPGVVCHIVEAMFLWMRGFADRGRQRARQGLELAESLQHPPSIAYAHFHLGVIHTWRREPERAAEHAQTVLDIAEAHEFAVWAAVGACLYGAATAATGAVEDGLALVEASVAQYRALKTPPVFWSSLLQFQAEVLGLAGRTEDGLARAREAIEALSALPEPQMMSSELFVLEGTLLRAHPNRDVEAEAAFERAVERADQLDGAMLQLRACTALARFWSEQGKTDPARELLSPAYDRLTEGFTTADLVDAKDLLEALSVRPRS
jgi:predicted ATPase/class 3 adenylate cyclase